MTAAAFFRTCLRFVPALPCLLLLAACESGASRWAEQFVGFPPTFADPALNQYRTRYLAERPLYDAGAAAFLRADAAGKDCVLPSEVASTLAETGYRAAIFDQNPRSQDIIKSHNHHETSVIFDQVALKVIEGDCSGGQLNGPVSLYMSYVRVAHVPGLHRHEVAEVQTREDCTFVANLRHGPCNRFQRAARWDGEIMPDGRLLPTNQAMQEKIGGFSESDLEKLNRVAVHASFDYGHFAKGIESGPGVAFETLAAGENEADFVENNTLSRTTLPDGRVKYVLYGGNRAMRSYVFKDGLAHGELVFIEPNVLDGPDGRYCYAYGEAVLTTTCTVR
jgi:hypothetical protein